MSGYYENIGEIQKTTQPDEDGFMRIPQSALDAIPYRISNIPPDEIVYGGLNTVMRDYKTRALMIDANDIVQPLPTTEWNLMTNPALMRVVTELGGKATDGYLVDYRRIGIPTYRDSRLEYGTDSTHFDEQRERNGTVFPLGIVFNNAGVVEYTGHPELHDTAADMIRRVDVYIAANKALMPPYPYIMPSASDAIERPKKMLTLTDGDLPKTSEKAPFRDTPSVSDTPSDEGIIE